MQTQTAQQAWTTDAPVDVSEGEITEAMDVMQKALHDSKRWIKGNLVDRCFDFIGDTVRDDLDDCVIASALWDSAELGEHVRDIAETALRKFVQDNLNEIERTYGMGIYAEALQ
jgi:hypothetical protein